MQPEGHEKLHTTPQDALPPQPCSELSKDKAQGDEDLNCPGCLQLTLPFRFLFLCFEVSLGQRKLTQSLLWPVATSEMERILIRNSSETRLQERVSLFCLLGVLAERKLFKHFR